MLRTGKDLSGANRPKSLLEYEVIVMQARIIVIPAWFTRSLLTPQEILLVTRTLFDPHLGGPISVLPQNRPDCAGMQTREVFLW